MAAPSGRARARCCLQRGQITRAFVTSRPCRWFRWRCLGSFVSRRQAFEAHQMTDRLRIARTVSALRRTIRSWRAEAEASHWSLPWGRCMPDILLWCARQTARASGGRLDLRQPGAVRAARRFRQLSPKTRNRPPAARRRGDRPRLGAAGLGHVSSGIRNTDNPGRRGHGGARRQVSSAFLLWRGDRGRQALDPVHTRLCHVRREGLSAAQGGHAIGGGPRPSGRDHRRGDSAREGRPRNVFTQRLSVGVGPGGGACAASRDRGLRRQDRARNRLSRPC